MLALGFSTNTTHRRGTMAAHFADLLTQSCARFLHRQICQSSRHCYHARKCAGRSTRGERCSSDRYTSKDTPAMLTTLGHCHWSPAAQSFCTVSRAPRRACLCPHALLGDNFRKFVESLSFENWAPRSARAWRLPPTPESARVQRSADRLAADELFINSLNERVQAAEPVSIDDTETSNIDLSPPTASFEDVQDDELSQSLQRQIDILAGSPGFGASAQSLPMSGAQLRDLVVNKYGKTYDVCIVRRDIPGKTLISLNIMWTHLEQASFPMSEEEYVDKLDTIASYLGAWGQLEKVRDFLLQPPRSMRGLPKRPIVGNAISLRLDMSRAQIQEWFGS